MSKPTPKELVDRLSAAFKIAEAEIPSVIVAITHLSRAEGIYKSMLRAGFVTPDQVVDIFANSMDWILAAPDPDTAPPEVAWVDEKGVITKHTGKKH